MSSAALAARVCSWLATVRCARPWIRRPRSRRCSVRDDAVQSRRGRVKERLIDARAADFMPSLEALQQDDRSPCGRVRPPLPTICAA